MRKVPLVAALLVCAVMTSLMLTCDVSERDDGALGLSVRPVPPTLGAITETRLGWGTPSCAERRWELAIAAVRIPSRLN
jgi:hypothetical protein